MGRGHFAAATCALTAIGVLACLAAVSCAGREATEAPSPASEAQDAGPPDGPAPNDAQKIGSVIVPIDSNDGILAEFDQIVTLAVDAAVPETSDVIGTLDAGSAQCIAYRSFPQAPLPPGEGPVLYSTQVVSAGPITVAGSDAAVTLLPVQSDASDDTTYPQPAGTFAWGDVLTLAAPGGVAPAFSVSLAAPDRVTWTTPSPSAPWVIDSSVDLSLAWTSGSVGTVVVYVAQPDGSGHDIVECLFPESAGSGVMPAAIWALFPIPTGTGSAQVVLSAQTVASQPLADGWTLDLRASGTILVTSATIE